MMLRPPLSANSPDARDMIDARAMLLATRYIDAAMKVIDEKIRASAMTYVLLKTPWIVIQ